MLDGLIDAVSNSITRTIDVLFRPFDIVRYLWFAAICFVTMCGSNPGSQIDLSQSNGPGGLLDPANFPDDLSSIEPLFLVLGLGSVVVSVVLLALVLALMAAFIWLGSHASFMWVDGIQRGTPRWESFEIHKGAANSIFKFRLLLLCINFGGALLIGALAIGAFVAMGLAGLDEGPMAGFQMGVMVLLVFMFFPIVLVTATLNWFVQDITVPVMAITGETVRPALKSVINAPGFDPLALLLYFLVRILIGIVMFIIMFPITLFCCCLFMIPGVSVIVFLPLYTFSRTLGMHWVAGLDERFVELANMDPLEMA